jgi:serine/threonine protein kinase
VNGGSCICNNSGLPCSQGEETLSVYLEYVSGGSIHKLLQEYGAFKEPVIQNYTRQIVSGLAYLHGRNTVHRYLGINCNHGSLVVCSRNCSFVNFL